MEPEVEKLMVDAFSKNFIDYEEYPVSADIQNRECSYHDLMLIAEMHRVRVYDRQVVQCAVSR